MESCLFFLQQSGNVANRFAGMRQQLAKDDFDPTLPIVAIAAIAATGAIVFLGRWWMNGHRWGKEFSKRGYDGLLDANDIRDWWRIAEPEIRADPAHLLGSAERFVWQIEALMNRGHDELATRLHQAWCHVHGSRMPLGRKDLMTAERVLVRNDHGTPVAEGFVRASSESTVTFLPYEPVEAPPPEVASRLYLEREDGMRIRARLDGEPDKRAWELIIGIEAEIGHRRADYRVETDATVFVCQGSNRFKELRDYVLHPPKPKHHLMAEHLAKNPPRLSTEFERFNHWKRGAAVRLDNISAGGARVSIETDVPPLAGEKTTFVFLSFEVDGRSVELLLPATWLCDWEHSTTSEGTTINRRRLQFGELEPTEFNDLRHLIVRLMRSQGQPSSGVIAQLPDAIKA